jgi:hypothetical protein
MVLSRVYYYSDNSIITNEFVRVNYDSMRFDEGSRSGKAITLQGRRKITGNSAKSLLLTGASYKAFDGKQLRYRCELDDRVTVGDTVTINKDTFVVGKIAYNASASNETMEISQYIPDGSDLAGSVGLNSRATTLKELTILNTNSNYSLWMGKAFFYTGIIVSTQTTGKPYTLYYDSKGLLWYMSGNEGQGNIPVLLANNSTQASINV